MPYTTIAYNSYGHHTSHPHSHADHYDLFDNQVMNLPTYPNTFVQNNTPDFNVGHLVMDPDILESQFQTEFPDPFTVPDNRLHDINPNNGFHFHTPESTGIDSFYYSGFSEDYPGQSMFQHFGGQLFTSSHNFHFTNPDGTMGYNDYLVIPRERTSVSLVDPDPSNPARFNATYGLNPDGTPMVERSGWPFISEEYDNFTGSSYGEALHWLEVFATQSAMLESPAYIGLPHGLTYQNFVEPYNPTGFTAGYGRNPTNIPFIDPFEQNYSGLSESKVWQQYIDEHIIGDHGGFHDTFTPRIF
ncbi:MAG: hypothetical protein AAF621_03170 [Pseudomonadota bacterium]